MLKKFREHFQDENAGTLEGLRAMYGFMGIALIGFSVWHFWNGGDLSVAVATMAVLGILGICGLCAFTILLNERTKRKDF